MKKGSTKKRFSKLLAIVLTLCMVFSLVPVQAFAADNEQPPVVDTVVDEPNDEGASQPSNVASVGETGYATLEEAVAAAQDGDTVTLLETASGNGIVIDTSKYPSGLTIDLGGNTYTVDGETVGSAGTETLGFQLLAGGKLTIKNGTVASTKAKFILQNYCDLILSDVTVDGTGEGSSVTYVVSNNNGAAQFIGNTSLLAPEGQVAFDVYYWPANGYGPVSVAVNTTGLIQGKIESASDGTTEEAQATIAVSGGTFTEAVPAEFWAEGFEVVEKEDGTFGAQEVAAAPENSVFIGTTGYASLEEAVAAAVNDDVITLNGDVEINESIEVSGKKITVNLQGQTLTFRNGTEVVVTAGADVTFTGGTIVANECASVTTAVMYVEAESTLTLDDVNFTTNGSNVSPAGNNAAVNVINGSVLTANNSYAVATNASGPENFGVVIHLQDSEFIGNSPIMINVPGSLTIENCRISGVMHGLIVRGGTAVVRGGTIEQNYTDEAGYESMLHYFDSRDWGTGNMVNLAAVTVGNKSTGTAYKYPSSLTMTGTTVASSREFPAVYMWANPEEENGITYQASGCDMTGEVVCGNEGKNVSKLDPNAAQIGSVEYPTLEKAIAAAKKGETVKLLSDVALTSYLKIQKAITLDLDKYSITGGSSNYTLVTSGNVTIIGSGVICNGTMKNAIQHSAGTLTIDGPAIKAGAGTGIAISTYGGTVNVVSGEISAGKKGISFSTKSSVVNVSGGTVSGGEYGIYAASTNKTAAIGTVNVTGGTVKGEAKTGIFAKNATVNLSGGTVSGVTAVDMQGGTIHISADAVVDASAYGVSLQNAVVADANTAATLIMDGGEVKSGAQAICGNNQYSQGTTATISGGKVIGGTGVYWPMGGTLTISDGAYIEGSLCGVEAKQGTINMTGGTVKSTGEYKEYAPSGNGTVGSGWALAVSTQQYGTTVEGVSSDVVVNITGGTIESVQGTGIETINMGLKETSGTITVSGGVTVRGQQSAIHTAAGTKDVIGEQTVTLTVTGGTFSSDVTDYCAEGYKTEKNEDSTYSVVQWAAKVGDQYFATLQEAVDQAEGNATVTLLKNVENGTGVIVNKNITIDFGYHKYTVASAPLAGSAGSKTQAFQLLAGSDKNHPHSVTMKNGTIVLPSTNPDLKMGIQNYTNLTLENVVVDASGNSNIGYVLSNNNGATKLTGRTSLLAPEGQAAFDVYYWPAKGYGPVSVAVNTTGRIQGKIECGHDNTVTEVTKEEASIAISGGVFTEAVLPEYCAYGYMPSENADSTYGVKVAVGTVEKPAEATRIDEMNNSVQITYSSEMKLAYQKDKEGYGLGVQVTAPETYQGGAQYRAANGEWQSLEGTAADLWSAVTEADLTGTGLLSYIYEFDWNGDGTVDQTVELYVTRSAVTLLCEEHTWGEWIVDTAAQCEKAGKQHRECEKCGEVEEKEIEALEHKPGEPTSEIVKEATCQEEGSCIEVTKCTLCEKVLTREVKTIEKKAHTPGEVREENVKEPTCTEGSYCDKVIRCTECNEVLSIEKNVYLRGPYGHNFLGEKKEVAGKAPTCVEDGYHYLVTMCTVCKGEGKRETIIDPATGVHTPGTPVEENKHAATCTAPGSYEEVTYCDVCEEELAREKKDIAIVPHTPGAPDREDVQDSTCTQTGSYNEVVRCTQCKTVISTEPKVIEMKEHTPGTPVEEITLKPTCVAAGEKSIVTSCIVCGTEITKETVKLDKIPHTEVDLEGQKPTCTEDGWTAGKHCTACNTDTVPQERIPALGHDMVTDEAVAATCTETGLTEGSHCSRCDDATVAQEEIPALGHDIVTDEAVAATCTETGLTEGSHCSRCDDATVAQEEIPALGHDIVTDEAVEATCTETGLTEGSHCSRCDDATVAQEEIPALGHDIVVDEAVEATCHTTGLTEGSHCSRCDEMTVEQEEVPMLEHVWDEGRVTKPATTSSTGIRTYTCTLCGDTREETIPRRPSTGGGSSSGDIVDIEDPDTPLGDRPMLFTDVNETHWFYGAVEFVFGKGYMSGYSDTTFAPNTNAQRGMIATILFNMTENALAGEVDFTDVSSNAYYAGAVAWAASNEVVSGYGDNSFAPTKDVTREELVTMLYNYAKFRGYTTSTDGDLSSFSDEASVSKYAVDPVKWAVGCGVMAGRTDNRLAPKDTAKRSEIASLIQNFYNIFMAE